MTDREDFDFDYFTEEGALRIVAEAEILLAKAREALEARRFMEADAWMAAALDSLKQDVTGQLAAGERAKAHERALG